MLVGNKDYFTLLYFTSTVPSTYLISYIVDDELNRKVQKKFFSDAKNINNKYNVYIQCIKHQYWDILGKNRNFRSIERLVNIRRNKYDGKSIFIEVLHIYIYDPVTIVQVSTPLHCCNIIKRVIPPFAIALSLWNYFYSFITGKTPIFLFF